MELKYSEILRRNADFSRNLPAEKYEIALLSNVIVSQSKDILEYAFRREGIPACVTVGDYDNIVQDSVRYKNAQLILIFWEVYNIIDGLQFKIELFNEEQVDKLFAKTTAELDFVFRNLKSASLVIINTFTALPFSTLHMRPTTLAKFANSLNKYVTEYAPPHVKVVDIENVIAHLGVRASFDLRYFYSSKAPYTLEFFKTYSECIMPYASAANGRSKKAVIFDCDNTLWKGVVGEDGRDGIQMSSVTKEGAIFEEVQSIAVALNKRGVLLGLCSKNNPEDVEEIIRSHPDMQIRDEHIAVKRINWRDKVSNLKDIAKELNIGLDALVFIDDSAFELNLIKEQLPQVTVLEVPSSLHLYPKLIRDSGVLFFNLSSTAEDAEKAAKYKQQARRQAGREEYQDLESYLSSLGTKMMVYEDERSIIPRVAQLTQKTNQFNLTTRRYTESDIASFVESERAKVFAFSISDKFGDSGVTGLCIVKIESHDIAAIDSLLMSCRILGRNIEYAFMNWLIRYLRNLGIVQVRGAFVPTQKNMQVRELFDRCSFLLTDVDEGRRDYSLVVEQYKSKPIEYVEIIDGRQNQERHGCSV